MIEIDAEFFGGGGEGHKGVPCPGTIDTARAKAYNAFPDAFSGPELCGVVMERDFRVIEHDEHGGFFRPGFFNTVIQGVIPGDRGEDLIEEVI